MVNIGRGRGELRAQNFENFETEWPHYRFYGTSTDPWTTVQNRVAGNFDLISSLGKSKRQKFFYVDFSSNFFTSNLIIR